MKKTILYILIISAALLQCCNKSDSSGGSNGNNNSGNNNSGNNSTPGASMAVAPTSIILYLPSVCGQTFTITNSGAAGSTLRYRVADDGAMPGYLDIANATGQLSAGAHQDVTVTVKQGLPNDGAAIAGANLVLNIYTTIGSNNIKVSVPVKVESNNAEEMGLAGVWSGTWTGKSIARNNPNQQQPTTAVNGTWELNINAVDTTTQTFKGSLVWKGTDAYWKYTYGPNGIILSATHYPFIPDRTIALDATNTSLVYDGSCTYFHLTINDTGANPSDAFYGPWFSADFDLATGNVITKGNGFITHPYDKLNFDTGIATGNITGSKQ